MDIVSVRVSETAEKRGAWCSLNPVVIHAKTSKRVDLYAIYSLSALFLFFSFSSLDFSCVRARVSFLLSAAVLCRPLLSVWVACCTPPLGPPQHAQTEEWGHSHPYWERETVTGKGKQTERETHTQTGVCPPARRCRPAALTQLRHRQQQRGNNPAGRRQQHTKRQEKGRVLHRLGVSPWVHTAVSPPSLRLLASSPSSVALVSWLPRSGAHAVCLAHGCRLASLPCVCVSLLPLPPSSSE